MSTRKAVGYALLVAGVLLIVFGIQASQSLASELSETFTGSPTNRAIWMIVGGVAATVLGAILGFGRAK